MCVLVLVFGLSTTAQAAAKPVSCFKTHSIFAKRSARGKAVYAAVQAKAAANLHKEAVRLEVTDAETFAEAMTKGMHLHPTQGDLFGIYLAMYFGNSRTELGGKSFATVMQILKENPNLEKSHFPEYEINKVIKVYESPENLNQYIRGQISTNAQFRSNLFQIEANLAFWKKILNFKDPIEPKALKNTPKKDSSDFEKEEYKKIRDQFRQEQAKSQKRFLAYLERIISKQNRDLLKDDSVEYEQKIEVLFKTLQQLAKHLEKNKKDSHMLRQVMVDLVHSTGYNNLANVALLKNSDALQRMEGLNKIFEERDSMAMKLDFEGHFAQLLEKLNIEFPSQTGVPESTTAKAISTFQQEILKGKFTTKPIDTIRVRSLSIQEAGFRSCLGGSDCSTRTYFSKAFDPNYHYFTMTDQNHKSSGHLTVVLGEAKNPVTGKTEKVAFADKLQNVPNHLIPDFLKAISMSLGKKGYRLAIPERLQLPEEAGAHAGLSNTPTIVQFVQDHILNKLKTKLVEFTPHTHSYRFQDGYSRANKLLAVRLYEPNLVMAAATEIRPGLTYKAYLPEVSLNKEDLIAKFLALRESKNPEDTLQYITSHKTVEMLHQQKLFSLDVFHQDLQAIMIKPGLPFKVRKTAWLEYYQNISNWTKTLQHFDSFSESEKANLLKEASDWWNSERVVQQKYSRQLLGELRANAFSFAEKEAGLSNLRLLFKYEIVLPETKNPQGETFFEHAVRAGNLKGAQFLLTIPRVYITDHFIAQIMKEFTEFPGKSIEPIKVLLNIPSINPTLSENKAELLVALAAAAGKISTIDQIIKTQYFNIDFTREQSYWGASQRFSAMELAVEHRQVEVVQYLLKQSEGKTQSLYSSLLKSIRLQQKQIFELLVERSDTFVYPEQLIEAMKIADTFYFDRLMEKPVKSINAPRSSGWASGETVLSLSALNANPYYLKRLLQVPGIDINFVDSRYKQTTNTVLHSYFHNLRKETNPEQAGRLIECIEILLADPRLKMKEQSDYGALRPIQAIKSDGYATPLMHAISSGSPRLIRKMIEMTIPENKNPFNEILKELIRWRNSRWTGSIDDSGFGIPTDMKAGSLKYVETVLKDPAFDREIFRDGSLLRLAVEQNDIAVVELFLQKMPRELINAVHSYEKKTVLDIALRRHSYTPGRRGDDEHGDMGRLLISRGARSARNL